MTVLLTRPKDDSARIAGQLAGLGINSLIWPLMEIVPVGGEIDIPEATEALLFTSSHAVRRYGTMAARRDLPALCVGKNTADVAENLGLVLLDRPAETASDLAELVGKCGHHHFMYLRGRDVARDLATAVAADGCTVVEQIVYAAEAATDVDSEVHAALSGGKITAVTIWSARQGAILAGFAARNAEWRLEKTDLVAISSHAAGNLQETGFRRILVASRPDASAMVQEISVAVRQKAE